MSKLKGGMGNAKLNGGGRIQSKPGTYNNCCVSIAELATHIFFKLHFVSDNYQPCKVNLF